MANFQQLSGQCCAHLETFEHRGWQCLLAAEVIEPFEILAGAAKNEGFEIKIVSAFRSFEQQLGIWNAKARGQRPLLDAREKVIAPGSLSGWPLAKAILRWSALPGASRHHWGTDFDIIDAAAMPADYQLQLTVAETQAGGVFAPFYRWLDGWLQAHPDTGFVRPYSPDSGLPREYSVASEPWHLSFAPLAARYADCYRLEQLRSLVENSELALKQTVLDHLPEIYQDYVLGRPKR